MQVIIVILLNLVSFSSFAGSLQMSTEYLSGQWCFTHSDFGGEENLNFTFNPDGSLLYQNSRYSDKMDREGSYSIVDDELKIRPMLAALTLRIKSIEESSFVLRGGGSDHFFVKGRCK